MKHGSTAASPTRNRRHRCLLTVRGQRRRCQSLIAWLAVLSLLWVASGAEAYVQSCLASRDPVGAMARLAQDPRVPMSSRARQTLRLAAVAGATDETRAAARPRVHAARQAVHEMQAVAADLARLELQIDGAAADTSALGPESQVVAMPLETLSARLERAHEKILAGFAEVEALFERYELSDTITQRHAAHRARYLENYAALRARLQRAAQTRDVAEQRAALRAAMALLRTSHDTRPRQRFDPTRLPFAVSKPTQRPPRTDWQHATRPEAAPTPDSESLRSAAPQSVAVAVAPPPGPEDLAPNEDVQITADIQALAASLDNDPLAIFDWVRNHIDFYPTFGSVQGSQLTLDMRRGNAFDIASLLIALLRAANVPARYVTGTVQIPVADVLNWLGGVPDADMVQQLLGSGGIANTAITSDGGVVSFELEHVWVAAYVDFVPSRGLVHIEGDTWVPLDAAFKLHTFVPASNFVADVPLGPVLDAAGSFFTVDETLGRITDVDSGALDTPLENWSEQAADYLETNGIEATPRGVLGGQRIISKTSPFFAGTLPYEVVARGAPQATLPANLRHTVQVKGYQTEFDRQLGITAFSTTLSLPALNSQRLGVQFDPATQADADILEAAREAGASSLPIASVNVTPVVKLDGTPLTSGSPVGMGTAYFLDFVLDGPDGATPVSYDVVAGDEIVVGVTGNGYTPEVLQKRLDNVPADTSAEYLHQVNLHYWAESDILNEQAARSLGGVILRLPSLGLFSSPLTVSYFFGQPSTGVYASKFMDVKRSFSGAAAPEEEQRIALVKQAGLNGSYLEGTVFDQLEDASDPLIKGIDAVKLLGKAAAQGIPLYRITPANRDTVLPLLGLDAAVESDISAALAQGQTVFAPERNVNVGPWSGVGYILQDETTGEGAYLISGGLNGGGLLDCLEELLPKVITVLAIVALIILAIILIILLASALAPVLAGIGAAAAEGWAAFLLFLRTLAPLMLAAA